MNGESKRLLAGLIGRSLEDNPDNSQGLRAGLATQTLHIPKIFLDSLYSSSLINNDQYNKLARFMYNDHVATLHVPALTWSALQTAGWGMFLVEVWFHVANKYTTLNPITSDYVVAHRFLGAGMIALVSGQAIYMQKNAIGQLGPQLADKDVAASLEAELAELGLE